MEGLGDRSTGARELRSRLLYPSAGGVPLSTRDVTDPRTATGWTLSDTEQSIPRRFAEQVRRHPDEVAIAGTSWQPTFEELDAAADGIARALTERNDGGRGRVALLMDHDAPLIAAMLGALKAGHSIVVLNPTDPAGRLGHIRRQAEPRQAVVDARHRELARGAGFTEVLDARVESAGVEAQARPEIDPDELAALMFTSGSTGRPKGVMHTHHTLLQTALRHVVGLGLRPDDRVALLASPSGGHGMGTTWMTLLSGATLCPFPVMDRGVVGLPEWLREHRITVFGLSASLFRRFVRTLDGGTFPDLRLVRLGSEQVRRADFDACRRHIGEDCGFANVYSLTEAGGLAHGILASGEEPPAGPLALGRPAPGIEIQLVDERGEPVPAGEPGEIVVRSRYLSPGYWRDEQLTAERYSGTREGEVRTLRTGDLGRFDDDGALAVIGRRDSQVKVRGYRVELGEIEAALGGLPEVAAAAAVAEPTRHGDRKLTAYLVAQPGTTPAPAELRDALRATLSEASIPTAFAFVDELPLNAHGKIDRELLVGLSPRASAGGATSAAPSTELERKLGEIWAEALELERVGRDDDFFDLGGDSLTAAEIGAGVHEAFSVELDMRAFSRHPTVAKMAELLGQLDGRRSGGTVPLERVPRDGPLPCSFAQERIWPVRDHPGYTAAAVTGWNGPLDVEVLRAALEQVAGRHEPLRTTFAEHEGRPVQIIHPPGPLEMPITDIGDTDDPEQRVIELLRDEVQAFDLDRGSPLRLRLVRVSAHDHRLLRVNHHLNTDARSWDVFFTEVVTAYQAICRGQAPRADDAGLQYADYAAWERRRLRPDGPLYREQIAWWRAALERPPTRLELPFARPARVPHASPDDAVIRWGIDPAVAETLDRLGRQEGATFYAVRLALFSAVLALESGQDDVTVGAYIDTRRLPETRSMFGYFSNLLALILPFDPGAPFRGWLRKVRLILIEATARSELPYEHLCDELRTSGRFPPEINAIFSTLPREPELPWVTIRQILYGRGRTTMPWGFNFVVDEAEESSRSQVRFDARLYDPAAVRAFVDCYAELAEAAGADPDRPLGELHPARR